MTNPIQLSDQSISDLQHLCQLVLKKYPTNELTTDRAKGIGEYLAKHRYVSEGQAIWLARNLDYNRVARPPELANIVVPKKSKVEPKVDENGTPPAAVSVALNV